MPAEQTQALLFPPAALPASPHQSTPSFPRPEPQAAAPLWEPHRWHLGSKTEAPKSPLLEAGWEMDALKLSKALGKEAEAQSGAACVRPPPPLCLGPQVCCLEPGSLWESLARQQPGLALLSGGCFWELQGAQSSQLPPSPAPGR